MEAPKAEMFAVAIVYIKPIELRAITVMLDERWWNPVSSAPGDGNEYTLGRIGEHNVILVGPPRGAQGTVATAQFISTIRLTFPNIAVGLLVGIGGGIPRYPQHDVRLGDVVVGAPESGPAVVQYDLGKRTESGFETNRVLAKPPGLLLQVVNKVENKSQYIQEGEDGLLKPHLTRLTRYPRLKKEFEKPSTPDRLFDPTFSHEPGTDCDNHGWWLDVKRHEREPRDDIVIHYSTILSGGTLMKSPKDRDMLSAKHNDALCIEMEAAGLMDVFPCLVVRGVSDYADSHKNSAWQGFAAATAASYAREVLINMSKQMVPEPQADSSSGGVNMASPQENKNPHILLSTHRNSGVQVGYNTGSVTNHSGGR
ncbi:nucleoside phosphorylase domain-containing protein [Nemania serpens]|nr:nucleoside phosphorylase domain-containing protein [Nemania serpens]